MYYLNFSEVRPLNGVNRVNGMGGGRGNIPNWPPAQPTTIKSWHAEVSNDLRHNLVCSAQFRDSSFLEVIFWNKMEHFR